MNSGINKKEIKKRQMIESAIRAMAEPVRIDIEMENGTLDNLMPIHEDDIYRIDVEAFIFGLSYRESVVLLFRSLDVPVKDIAPILHLHPSRLYVIIESLEKKANQRI
jgi:hypothetical protein